MTVQQLEEHFGIPGVLTFRETPTGLAYAQVSTSAASGTIYMQGAHLAAWQPVGERPVLFLSRQTELAPGKPIRGGVPIAFPWFSSDKKPDRIGGKPGPSHGFARTEVWTLAFAALVPGGRDGKELHLSFTLAPTEASRALGFGHFRAAFQVRIGRRLTMRLTIANEADSPLVFEEALHTYFAVGDVRTVTVTGLEQTGYLDKTENFAAKEAAGASLRLTGEIDRIYDGTGGSCLIEDPTWHRRISVAKENSDTTVVWNPWRALPDLGAEEWPGMLCVETANASASQVVLDPGTTHTMQAMISVEAAE